MNSIETKKLTKIFGNKIVVDNIDLTIKKGEIFSLLGVNGAGKTTTIKMLTGLLKPTSGDAILDNYSILSDINNVKKVINISPQETAVAPNLTVKENLYFVAGIYEIKNKEDKVNELIKLFNFNDVVNQRAKTLSGGWQRKLSIAMSLINDPDILFLDEPALGLDVLARRELWNIIKSFKHEKTIILTTHYMEEASELSDRLAIMSSGKILDMGSPKDLIKKYKKKTIEEVFVCVTGGVDNENN